MQLSNEIGERMVHAVLAAQVTVLRERIDASATVELLWQTSDVLSQMADLIVKLDARCHDPALEEQCTIALTAKAEINRLVDRFAFDAAQRNDFTCQSVDCIVTALGRLAATDAPVGSRLSLDDLAALYVSNDQRDVHESTLRQLLIDTSPLQPL